ncbi:hypothetical protein GL2_37950 [Microbulbifer sp. GL-2]|nr:hypothetical protein GL2_37950 [Microbulbifer sp. GL-2]
MDIFSGGELKVRSGRTAIGGFTIFINNKSSTSRLHHLIAVDILYQVFISCFCPRITYHTEIRNVIGTLYSWGNTGPIIVAAIYTIFKNNCGTIWLGGGGPDNFCRIIKILLP